MEDKIIQEEKKYLNEVIVEIQKQKMQKQRELKRLDVERKEFSLHFSDDFYTMDDEEALGEGDLLKQLDDAEDLIQKNIETLSRQENSPFFGRVDFKKQGSDLNRSYYIGVNNLIKIGNDIPLICDWRAPVSSLFYDYELGDAEYVAPDGKIAGQITKKRQYQIKNKELLKAFDSSITIGDEILKDVLSENASNKMKTIVSTIQKEQNKIIRNNKNSNMLVQGVAGSGKTSIALHRVAYLLYQNKNTLKAEDILILSPNTIFSEYISEVLPELGENNMSQMSFYRLAVDELSFLKCGFETREQNLSNAVTDNEKLNRAAYKHSYEFYESLCAYCENYFNLAFAPKDLKFGKDVITAVELNELYNKKYVKKSPAIRVEWIIDYIIDKLDITTSVQEVSERLKRIIYPFFAELNILNIYAQFLRNIGMEFSLDKKGNVCYDDLAPLLYIKHYFLGLKKRKEVKYLIIDEMQDYSFVAYKVFNEIFDCNKTILGDINQCIEKVMDKNDLQRLAQMINAEYVELNKAYRSTYEIVEFANKIKNITCEKIDRHGNVPVIVKTTEELFAFKDILTYNSIAVLTKTEEEAKNMYMNMADLEEVNLVLTSDDEMGKINIMPSYIAKGLEFDVVIIPNYNNNNYKTFLDKNLLYVSCTRALHELCLIKN